MVFYAHATPLSVVLASTGDTLGIALMISGFGAALVLGALALRDWRRRDVKVRLRALPRRWQPELHGVPFP